MPEQQVHNRSLISQVSGLMNRTVMPIGTSLAQKSPQRNVLFSVAFIIGVALKKQPNTGGTAW
jgi:hypothetical protein